MPVASEVFRLLTKQVESADSHLGLLLGASEQDIWLALDFMAARGLESVLRGPGWQAAVFV